MRLVALICNILLFGFMCLVLITDGFPREIVYIVFTLLTPLILILNALVIFRSGMSHGWLGFQMKKRTLEELMKIDQLFSTNAVIKIITIISNFILLGVSCWAFVSQYPHPKEEGFIVFTLLVFLTPVISIYAVLIDRVKNGVLA